MVHGACVKVMVMIKVKCKMVLPGVGNRYHCTVRALPEMHTKIESSGF